MQPHRVDFIVDLAYGVMILVAIVLITSVGVQTGIAFGLGILISYVIHVVWKMARFDPEWMTREITESVEETISQEVNRRIEEVDEYVEQIDEKIGEVDDRVEEVDDRVEEVDDRVDRRPREDEIEETVEEIAQDPPSRGRSDDAPQGRK